MSSDNKIKNFLSKELDVNLFINEKIITYMLCIVALAFPVLELICEICGHTFALQEGILRTAGIMFLVYAVFCVIYKKKHILVWSDIFFALSIVFSVISIIFSLDIEVSLGGCYVNMREDPQQVLGYFMIFFMATQVSEYENRKKIIIAMLIVCAFHTIPSILQYIDLWPYPPQQAIDETKSYGLTQHYNFYGALAVMFTGLTTMIFLFKKTIKSYVWYAVATVCFVASLFAECRLVWVGTISFFVLVICIEIYLKKKNKESLIDIKRLAIIIVTFGVVFVLFMLFASSMREQLLETYNEVSGDNLGQLGNNRFHAWYVGLVAVKDHLLTGVGFDNYEMAFFLHPELVRGWTMFKGHNEYIHTLVTQGLPSAINYIAMCFYVWIFGIKKSATEKDSNQRAIYYILLVMVTGYFVQAFFNSSVTNIAPYKWLVMGLLVPRCIQKLIWENKEKTLS